MTECLRPGMYCKMFGTGCCLHCIPISLKCFYKGNSQFFCKIRIFPISFMASTPSWITENIDIRRPERQSLINISVTVYGICIIPCSALCCHDTGHLCHTFPVKSCRHSDRLWKNRCLPCSGNTVKSLIPPVIRRNSQSFYCRCIVP